MLHLVGILSSRFFHDTRSQEHKDFNSCFICESYEMYSTCNVSTDEVG